MFDKVTINTGYKPKGIVQIAAMPKSLSMSRTRTLTKQRRSGLRLTPLLQPQFDPQSKRGNQKTATVVSGVTKQEAFKEKVSRYIFSTLINPGFIRKSLYIQISRSPPQFLYLLIYQKSNSSHTASERRLEKSTKPKGTRKLR